MNHEIYIEKKNKLYIEPGISTTCETAYITTMLKNLESFNYTLSDHVVEILKTYTKEQLEVFYFDIVAALKRITGSDVVFTPMYPDFPPQIMDSESTAIYFDTFLQYFSLGSLYTNAGEVTPAAFHIDDNTTILEIGTKDEYLSLFINLMNSNSSFSRTDKRHLSWFFRSYNGLEEVLPNEFPLKENTAYICRFIIEETALPSVNFLRQYINTAGDVLRLAVAMSNGDVSLKVPCKFRSFRRKERRILLELLDISADSDEDLMQYKNRFIRLGERLHPNEFTQFPNAINSFKKLRDNLKVETFSSKLTKAFEEGNYRLAVSMLSEYPEQLAKQLDFLIRISGNPIMIINAFMEVASNISTPMLWQIKEHFAKRNYNPSNTRVFFPKGKTSRPYTVSNNLPIIDQSYCESIVETCEAELMKKYSSKKPLGKVFISDSLKDYIMPFKTNGIANRMNTLASGSKIAFTPTAPTLRSFVWWRNGESYANIELTGIMYDKYWNYIEPVPKQAGFNSGYLSSYSNSPIKAVKGYSQYLDIDLPSVLQYGCRYLVLYISNKSGTPLNDLSKCYMGYMERQRVESAEIYEPQSLETKVGISVNTPKAIPMIIDLQKSLLIWTDLALKSDPSWTTVGDNLNSIAIACKSLIEPEKPNLYDFLELHASVRGERCFIKENADIVFDIKDGITPYDIDILTTEFL